MKVSDYIVSYFESQGVKIIFGYIGGMITHLVDSIGKNPNMRFVQTYHEQTAAIAAEGYALESGRFGVSISTSGPGVTNMMTGIADAYFDSIPVIYISGQVNTYEYKYDKPLRQLGFQETDVVSIVTPLTKYAKLVDHEEDIRYELEKAVYLATTGRKGPVLLDIPMNIQRAEVNPESLCSYEIPISEAVLPNMENIASIIGGSKHPMLLLGAGCISEKTQLLLEKFLEKTQIPVVTSLMGRGCIDETYSNYIGMIGSYGNRCANMGIANADVLIALGTRLDTRQTGAQLDSFLPEAQIIHVDIDENELDCNRLPNRTKVLLPVDDFIAFLLSQNICYGDFSGWNSYLVDLKAKYNQDKEIDRFVENKAPYLFMKALNGLTQANDIITADIGQNQMWAAQTLKLKNGQKFVTSGGLAPMGFSLPAAIGMSFASPEKQIYCINGDGGFQMAVQSLLLISQYQLPIKVIVMNNEALGMITQFQHLYFDDRMEGTTSQGGYITVDMKQLASAYRLDYLCLNEDTLHEETLMKIKNMRLGIIDYKIEGLTTVSPKLEYNKPIYMPLPLLSEDELNENLLINE